MVPYNLQYFGIAVRLKLLWKVLTTLNDGVQLNNTALFIRELYELEANKFERS